MNKLSKQQTANEKKYIGDYGRRLLGLEPVVIR